jgi:hypothetical protein
MPQFKTCTEYEAALAELGRKLQGGLANISQETATAQRSCESIADPQARDNCKTDAGKKGSRRSQALSKAYDQQREALRKQAIQDGVLFDALIITDPRHATEAATLKKGQFADASIIKVSDVDAFIKELEKDRCAVFLMLVLDGDDTGQIEIEGKRLSRQRLTAAQVKLRAWEMLVLEGVTLLTLRPSYEEVLKSKLSVAAFRDNWVVLVPLPQPPKIAVDADDPKTHKIESVFGSHGLDHFVTVRGDGEVRLRATLTSDDTDENRKAIGWTASAGTTLKKTPGDPLSVSLSRGTWKKVEVWVTFKGTAIKPLIVWIVWCEVTAEIGRQKPPPVLSSLDGETLGWQELRAEPPDPDPRFEVWGNVDWRMKINPPEVINDADRPALESQTAVRVPGGSASAPSPFCGWEFASDTRLRTAEVIPPSKKVIVTLDQHYKWPGGDVQGKSEADVHMNPYRPDPGWPSRWRSSPFEDAVGHPNGHIAGFHQQARIFVRVQLSYSWYRCSKDYFFRFRASARWKADPKPATTGKWKAEPKTQPVLQLNNNHWANLSPSAR